MAFLLAAGVLVLALGEAEVGASQAPERPTWKGSYMLAGAGATAAFGLIANVLRYSMLASKCDEREECRSEIVTSHVAFGTPAAILNLASIGLAVGGGKLRRQYDDWQVATGRARPRNATGIAIGGGALLGAGVLAGASAWTRVILGETNERQELAPEVLVLQGSAMLTAAGAGMLSYGLTSRTPDSVSPPPSARTQPTWDGKYMLAGAGAVAALGLGLSALQAANAVCDEDTMDCGGDRIGVLIAFGIPAAALDATSIGLAAAGGKKRRRHDDWRVATGTARPRNTRGIAIGGGVLLGAGIVGAPAAALLVGSTITMENDNAAVITRIALFQTAAMLAGAGAGMLAYGVTPRSGRRERNKHTFHLAPMLGSSMGLSFGGRF